MLLLFLKVFMIYQNYIPLNDLLRSSQFEMIKTFILKEGDRKFYCNRFNNNPHYKLTKCDVYLNPSDPRNINCDSNISDFNVVVFYNPSHEIQYLYLKIAQLIDVSDSALVKSQNLEEYNVYLMTEKNEENLLKEKELLKNYLSEILYLMEEY